MYACIKYQKGAQYKYYIHVPFTFLKLWLFLVLKIHHQKISTASSTSTVTWWLSLTYISSMVRKEHCQNKILCGWSYAIIVIINSYDSYFFRLWIVFINLWSSWLVNKKTHTLLCTEHMRKIIKSNKFHRCAVWAGGARTRRLVIDWNLITMLTSTWTLNWSSFVR